MTLHLNKKQVLFHVQRSQQLSKQLFHLQLKNQAEQSSKRHFWNVLNVFLESFYFAQETKAVFINIRYHKTSQTQDVKSQSTKPNFRKMAQPKCDSAFEQKTRIVSSREIWGSFQNRCCSYNQKIKPSRAQKDIFGTYSTSFRKSSVLLKKQKLFFICIRFHKTSQTQVVKSQSTECSVRKIAQPKLDSAFEQKTRIVPNRETSVSSQNMFLSYNQRKKQSIAQKDISGTYSTSFWKVSVLLKKQKLFL